MEAGSLAFPGFCWHINLRTRETRLEAVKLGFGLIARECVEEAPE